MRAVVLRELGGPGKPALEELEDPRPVPGQIVVRLRAAALNRRDLFITYGQYPGIELPSVMGSDGAGHVEVLPPDYRGDLTVGTDVVILPSLGWGDDPRQPSREFTTLGVPRDGTFADLVAVPTENVFPMPGHLAHAEAAALPLAGVTAYRALVTRGEVRTGETVLVPGAGGGVAAATIQLAHALGARVLVTSGREEHLGLARELGAEAGVSTRGEDWVAALREHATSVDLVVDTVGGEQLNRLLRLVRPGGRIVSVGASAGPVPELVLPYLFLKQIDVRGTSMGTGEEFAALLDLYGRHHLRPRVGARFPLADVRQALELMESGGAGGKIVLDL